MTSFTGKDRHSATRPEVRDRLHTPVLFIVFNRPETTSMVFQEIRKARPPRLYVAADGPRAGRAGEAEKVEQVRRIATRIDWDCELKTLFSATNLGCSIGPSRAISWLFQHEEDGIILEDDCLPSQSFFRYCEQLLEWYRDDSRVMMISGHNVLGAWHPERHDYFFSNLGGIWGWASWKRAWQKFDLAMPGLDGFIEGGYFQHLFGRVGGELRARKTKAALGNSAIWDYMWGYARHVNSGMSCVPSRNLITNVGFGVDATHRARCPEIAPRYEINLPVRVNPFIVADRRYDQLFLNPFKNTALARLSRWLKE